jgi:D-galactarolactone cycloisomerase
MKIVDWKVYTPDKNFHVFLELQTDTNVTGWGAAYSEREQVLGALGWLKRFVMGENPLEMERVTEKLHQVTFWLGRGGAMTHAISAINLALWDVAGTFAGQPVSVLLGGRYREAVPAYGSVLFAPVETLPARIESMLARGFRAIKLGWDPFGHQSLQDDEALIRLARKATGNKTTRLSVRRCSQIIRFIGLKSRLHRTIWTVTSV